MQAKAPNRRLIRALAVALIFLGAIVLSWRAELLSRNDSINEFASTNTFKFDSTDAVPSSTSVIQPDASVDMPRTITSVDLVALPVDRNDSEFAYEAALPLIGRMEPQQVLRWRAIVIEQPLLVITDSFDKEANNGPPNPRQIIMITPFPSVMFVVENDGFDSNDLRFIWKGKLIEGGNGRATVIGIRREDGNWDSFVNIVSDQGDFNIAPANQFPYHVAMEANRLMSGGID